VRLFVVITGAVALAACNPSTVKGGTTGDGATSAAVSAPGTSTTTTNAAAHEASTSGGHLKVVEATQDSDALSLVRTRRLEAKAEGRVLVVYVGATWCEPCKRFKAEVSSGRLDARFGKLTLLAFDADRDGDRLAAAGYTYRFVPFVALPAADGQPSDTQQATGKGGEAWRELLGKLDAWTVSAAPP
jgi:thiol-disulfide isomerase/thioredoxin